MRLLRSYRFLTLSGLGLLMLSLILFRLFSLAPDQLARNTGRALEEQLQFCSLALDELEMGKHIEDPERFFRLYEQKQIAVYRLHKDSLEFWNNSRINPHWLLKKIHSQEGIVQSAQGYFLFSRRVNGAYTNLAFCQLKPDYPIQNNYLKNHFLKWTGLPENAEISAPKENSFEVKAGGKSLFFFSIQEPFVLTAFWQVSLSVLFYLSFVLLLGAAVFFAESGKGNGRLLIALVLVFFYRFLISWFKWPEFIYLNQLYDLREFGDASSLLGIYYGDILFNAVLLLFSSFIIYRKIPDRESTQALSWPLFFSIAGAVLTVLFFYHSLSSMVENSTLGFNFLSVYNMKPLAFGGLAIAALILISLFGFLYTAVKLVFYGKHGLRNTFFFTLTAAACVSLIQPSMHWSGHLLLPAGIFGILLLKSARIHQAMYYLFLHLVIYSVFSSLLLNYFIDRNNESEMRLLSYTLSERQDAALENEFRGVEEKIIEDKRLMNLIDLLPNTRVEIGRFLKQSYFSSYFNRFNVEFFLFDEKCQPLLESTNALYSNQGYFEDQINYHSDSSQVKDLFLIRDHKSGTRYISSIQLRTHKLFILIDAKELGEQGSFPDLLLDASQQKQQKSNGISFAVYRAGKLVNRFGDINYPYTPPDSALLAKNNSACEHHVYQPDEDTKVIISKGLTNLTGKFTYNSYILVMFFVSALVFLAVYRIFFSASRQKLGLTQRIQSAVILLLLFAITAVGLSSVRLVSRQFENETKKELAEKSAIVLSSLLEEYKTDELFDATQPERVIQSLIAISRNMDCDISLYSSNGKLISSTQPKLYELGLSSDLLNPRSFLELRNNRAYFSTPEESAGELNYFSHYLPLFGEKKEIMGYVNLPYFSRQSGLQKELSALVSALINVYLALFVLSLFVSLLLSGYITQPLRFIKQQMARLSFGQPNEAIAWSSNDEIGKLVQEYNQMLHKLEESAKLLAASERESAWREMAKQVAHEIKNPLTPMKLNLQHLQYLSKTDPQEFNKRFESAGQSIIEQIDSLANIATAFSNFARLPGFELQDIEPLRILESAVQLFSKTPHLKFEVTPNTGIVFCKGDKEQCMRVFNNILSNAVEALEGLDEAKVTIHSRITNDKLIISIRDNGCGIPEELKASLFSPNFTTKSSGSGLGLAMVKNIMQGFGGRVWFESEKGKGSVFYLEFVRLIS